MIGDGFTGFVEAPPQSEWWAALKRRDCQTLLHLLQGGRNLWREIDSNGRTVLHVAVMQGCSRLVNEVLRSVNPYDDPNTKSSVEMLRDAKDTSLCGADVIAIADIVGNADVRNLIFEDSPANNQPGGVFQVGDVNLRNRIQQIFGALQVGGFVSMRLQDAFEDDVDYNFVQRGQQFLCLHVACKDPNLVDFLLGGMRHTKSGGDHLLQALFELKDAQGRTLLHVAVEEDGLGDNSRDKVMAVIVKRVLQIFDEVPACNDVTSQNCLNARDLGGRTPLHRAVANKRAGRAVIKVLVKHPKTHVNARWRGDNVFTGDVTALHLAVVHNNVDAAKYLLKRDTTDGDIQCALSIKPRGSLSRNDFDLILSDKKSWSALELATIMGHAHIVDAMLKVRDKYI